MIPKKSKTNKVRPTIDQLIIWRVFPGCITQEGVNKIEMENRKKQEKGLMNNIKDSFWNDQ